MARVLVIDNQAHERAAILSVMRARRLGVGDSPSGLREFNKMSELLDAAGKVPAVATWQCRAF